MDNKRPCSSARCGRATLIFASSYVSLWPNSEKLKFSYERSGLVRRPITVPLPFTILMENFPVIRTPSSQQFAGVHKPALPHLAHSMQGKFALRQTSINLIASQHKTIIRGQTMVPQKRKMLKTGAAV